MHSSPDIVGCVGMLLDIPESMPASLPPGLRVIILNAKRNNSAESEQKSPSSLLDLHRSNALPTKTGQCNFIGSNLPPLVKGVAAGRGILDMFDA
jgi:hypothetical protein